MSRRVWLIVAVGTACSPGRDVARPVQEQANEVGVDARLVDTPVANDAAKETGSVKSCPNDCKELSHACDEGCPKGEAGRGCLKKCGCALITCEDACSATGKADFKCH